MNNFSLVKIVALFLLMFLCSTSLCAQHKESPIKPFMQQYLNNNYYDAIALGKELLGMNSRITVSEEFSLFHLLGNCYYRIDSITMAKSMYLKAEMLLKNEEIPDWEFIYYVFDSSNFLISIGENKRAVNLMYQGLRKYDTLEENEKIDLERSYSGIMALLALCHYNNNEYNRAVDLLEKIIEIDKRNNDYISETHANTLLLLISCYLETQEGYKPENYSKLLNYIIELKNNPWGTSKDNWFNTRTLTLIATWYMYIEEYDEAIEYFNAADRIYIYRNNYFAHLQCLFGKAKCYARKGDFINAIETNNTILVYLYTVTNSIDFNSINNLSIYDWISEIRIEQANCYVQCGEIESAIKQYVEVQKIYNLSNKKSDIDNFMIMGYLADCYSLQGNYNEARTILLDLVHKSQNIDHDLSFDLQSGILLQLSIVEYLQGDYSNASAYMKESINKRYVFDSNNLGSLPKKMRTNYWDKIKNIYQIVFPNIVLADNDPSAFGELYDKSALFAKGIMLNSEKELLNLVLESGDSILTGMFEELQAVYTKIDAIQANPLLEDRQNLESLKDRAELLQATLLNGSKSYGNIIHNLNLTWKDVQNKLGKKDIAIEFLTFSKLDSDSALYIALTVRKDYDRPHMVFLGEEHELQAAAKNAYTNSELSKLIWGRLSNELYGVKNDTVKNIYFSPSGMLHQVAIESMPHWMNIDLLMNQCYNIYRLSSTRELAIDRENIQPRTAAVYGDINYNTEVKLLPTSYMANDPFFLAENRGFDADSAGYRGKIWNPLYNTKDEVDSITSILESKGIMADYMTKDTATETSFKYLAGKKKSIIHVATHGFCWSDSTASKYNMKKQLSFMIGENYEDKVMSRTGLLFSGANNCFADSVKIPNDKDDGVLTAREASSLDLRGLDLLVLSACQTGQGEVIGGEGVFGLQRGFKKAGARSIIMSLWSVNDKATSEMMTKFYHYYFDEGMTKREAFLKAQQYIKDKDNDYIYDEDKETDKKMRATRPHWAAFILLDALDN